MTEALRAQTISGLRWTVINAIGEKALSFGTTVVLARILDPHHFGLYALAFVAIDSLGVFKNLGLDAAIVQRKDRVDEAADTAFVVQPILALSLYALLAVCAPFIAQLLQHPEISEPIRVLGLIIVVMSLGNVPAALIQKTMRFRLRTLSNLTGMVVYAVMAIILARRGAGVFSLITAYLMRWTVCTVIQWLSLGWVPRFRFDWELFKEMLHFSKYIVGTWTIAFLSMNVDRLVIGRWLGITELGYYTLCMGLATLVASQISARAYQVVFPAFSQVQKTPDLVRKGFLKLVKYLLLAACPAAVLLMMLPKDLLHAFYGPKWWVAGPILQVLAVFGIAETLRLGTDSALLGAGKQRLVFKLSLVHLLVQGTGGVWMAHIGSITGVAWMVTLASGFPALIMLTVMGKSLNLKTRDWWNTLRTCLMATAVMVGVLLLAHWLRRPLLGTGQPSGIWLATTLLSSLGVYVFTLWRMDPSVTEDVAHLAGFRLPVFKGSKGKGA